MKGSFAIAAKSRAVWARCFLNSLSNIVIPPVTLAQSEDTRIGGRAQRGAAGVWISWLVRLPLHLPAAVESTERSGTYRGPGI